jgi:alkylhydroperoxidase/carboxymuconolactone decarboxylase family protein YurZ
LKTEPLQPIAPRQWAPELAQVIADMNGAPINVQRLMANNPTLLRSWWPFRNHAVKGGALGPRLVELLILRVAVHVRSWYEWGAHVDRALQVGISPADIRGLLLAVDAHPWPAAEAALLHAADELAQDHAIGPGTLELLDRHYDNKQQLDLVAIHGMYLTLAGMINTWQPQLDEDIQQRVAAHTTEQDFLAAATDFRRCHYQRNDNREDAK